MVKIHHSLLTDFLVKRLYTLAIITSISGVLLLCFKYNGINSAKLMGYLVSTSVKFKVKFQNRKGRLFETDRKEQIKRDKVEIAGYLERFVGITNMRHFFGCQKPLEVRCTLLAIKEECVNVNDNMRMERRSNHARRDEELQQEEMLT